VSFTSSGLGGGDGGGGSSLLFGHKSAEMSMAMTAAAAATPVFLQRRFGCCLECARSTLAPPSPSLACSSPSSPWSSSSQCGLSMSMKKQIRMPEKNVSNPARGVFVRASGSTAVADPEGLQVLLPSEFGFQFPGEKKHPQGLRFWENPKPTEPPLQSEEVCELLEAVRISGQLHDRCFSFLA
jgi:hypothetical protein